MKVVWTPLAVDRASEITEHISLDNPTAASQWVEGLFKAVERLAKFPKQGRVVPEVGRSDIRELLYESYRVIYRVESKRVSILTVRHGRRLIDKKEI
jgi:plasmid stabilization system protein ParE